MRWRKRGHVYAPDGSRWWAAKYASFPTVDVLGDILRVYFTGLDGQNFGRTGYVDLDARDPSRVVYESSEPVLDLGELGTFDDSGSTAFSIVSDGGRKRLYYQGWQRTERVPYLIFSGVAIDDGGGGGFVKHSRTPILDRREDDPFIRGAPFTIKQGDLFRMWYVSARGWIEDAHGLHYEVDIRHATSPDGVRWKADEHPCVSRASADEYAVGRPSVLLDDGVYRMWYSIRSMTQPYRLGYAESSDGVEWTRRDSEVGIERSSDGWDSAMICYANVVRVDDRILMFYNGNRHGETGFGYAEAVL
jgi:predicted GH43/DUF377 family glycosyl hydrolase